MIDIIELAPGENILDLGQRDGLDPRVLLSRIPDDGFAYGVASSTEASDAVYYAARSAGVLSSVEVYVATPDAVPLPDGEIDQVVAEDVLNPLADKVPVLREIARVLVPGGRLTVADVVAESGVTPEERAASGEAEGSAAITGCLTVAEWEALLADAGFVEVGIELLEPVADRVHDAVLRAVRR